MLHDLLGQFTKHNESFETSSLVPEDLGGLIDAVEEGKLTSTRSRK